MKNIILSLMLLVSATTKAQTNPNTDTVKIPFAVAKQIAIDLTSYDSTRSILGTTQTELDLTKQQLNYKDSLLTNAVNNVAGLSKQLTNQQQQSETYKQLYTVRKEDYDTVSKKLRKHRALRNFIDVTGFIIVAILMYVVTAK